MKEAAKYLYKSPWFPNLFICLNETAGIGLPRVIRNLPKDGIVPWLKDIPNSMPTCDYDPLSTVIPVLIAMVISTVYTLFKMGAIKFFGSMVNCKIPSAIKWASTTWICLGSIVTVAFGAVAMKKDHNLFFFQPSTSFLYWDMCPPLPRISEAFFLLQIGFRLHSVLILLIDTLEKSPLLHIKIASHFSIFVLLCLTYFLRFFEPMVVLLILFEVREFLWRVFEQTLQPQDNEIKTAVSMTRTIILIVCFIYQCTCLYWLITKFIYFFAVLYPVKSHGTPFLLPILALLILVLATEICRLVALTTFCCKRTKNTEQRKTGKQSLLKKKMA